MKLRATGKLGELCNEAGVPILPEREKVIGFRQLTYTAYRMGLRKKVVLPRTGGWVYLTDSRILMLDDGWKSRGGESWKTFHEVSFMEAQRVRYKLAKTVWVDVEADGERYAIAYRPYGAAARLFAWLLREKDVREKREKGELESPYARDKWYRHPPK